MVQWRYSFFVASFMVMVFSPRWGAGSPRRGVLHSVAVQGGGFDNPSSLMYAHQHAT